MFGLAEETEYAYYILQGWATLVMEGLCPADFIELNIAKISNQSLHDY